MLVSGHLSTTSSSVGQLEGASALHPECRNKQDGSIIAQQGLCIRASYSDVLPTCFDQLRS